MQSKKPKTSASASTPQLFAVDFNKEIGKLVAVTGDFWKLKIEDAKKQFECTVLEYDPEYKFPHLASNSRGNRQGGLKLIAKGDGEAAFWMNPDMYMQYKNSSALNKTSLSQKLAETAVLAIDDQNDDSDDDFINLDSNSKVDKPTSKTGIKTYFTQLKTEPYTKQDGSTGVRTYFACNLEVDGKPCSRF